MVDHLEVVESVEAADTQSASVVDIAARVAGVRQVYETGRTRPVAWRRTQLDALVALLTECEAELIDAAQTDLGKPALEAFATEIGHTRSQVRYLRKHFEQWARPRRVNPGVLSRPATAEVQVEPLGVALIIAPWNYPIQLLLEPLAAAIAAGNAAVVKPSELAPTCSAVLARRLPEYLDPEAVVVIEGGVQDTTELLEQRFDHIFFTGSTAVGRVVMTAAAKHLTPVTLELGGKSPAIVAADADLDVAARRLVWAKFLNVGQTCIAPDYVLVEESVKDRFVDAMVRTVERYYGSDPAASADLGRIVNDRHHGRLVGLLTSSGGTVVAGGTTDAATRYVAPTIIVDPDIDSPIMNEEIFGPLLPVVAVADLREAVSFVNARPKPLALYVFTESSDSADLVLDQTSSGGACVNHAVVHVVPEHLAFGGVGESGMGSYHGQSGFDAFSHHKSVLRKPTRADPPMLFPPYSTWKERLVRLAFR